LDQVGHSFCWAVLPVRRKPFSRGPTLTRGRFISGANRSCMATNCAGVMSPRGSWCRTARTGTPSDCRKLAVAVHQASYEPAIALAIEGNL
jgi:hypothetical protein